MWSPSLVLSLAPVIQTRKLVLGLPEIHSAILQTEPGNEEHQLTFSPAPHTKGQGRWLFEQDQVKE